MEIEIVETGATEKVLRAWHVDDSKNFRELLASFLALQPGIKCERSLPSAESALDALAREQPPDVILLDVRMDGMSGLDAITPIKRLAPQTAVLMLTTLYGPEDRARAIKSGASDILLKTFRVEEIVERARRAHGTLILGRANESQQPEKSFLPMRANDMQSALVSSCGSRSQPTHSTLLSRVADLIRQFRLAWITRRRQTPAVSS